VKKVLVVHPGLQHSYQLAWALEDKGLLFGMWSGIPVVDFHNPQKGFWGLYYKQLHSIPVSAKKRKHFVFIPLLRKLADYCLPQKLYLDVVYKTLHAYDFLTARMIQSQQPDMIICYENSALKTFRVARSKGIVCVLDAAAIHYKIQEKWFGSSNINNPAWIRKRKEEEIELADGVLTCSELAAESYREAGVPAEKVYPVPLGADLPQIALRHKKLGKQIRFLFIGSFSKHKSIDLLLDVFADLQNEGINAQLTLIGGSVDESFVKRAEQMLNVTMLSFMSQKLLFEEIKKHDCLLLVSRFDSFGMVVPEAMAVGLPAVVSDRVGAKCIVEQHPESGWIVPCEQSAIKKRIKDLVQNSAKLIKASPAARQAAQDYSWESYRENVVNILHKIHTRAARRDTH